MKIKTILEMAFPHCIVRSFHYAQVSLPTSGADVAEPRDGLCTLGGGLPGQGLRPTQPPVGSYECPCLAGAVGPHTVSTPLSARSPGEGPLCGKSCFDKT